MRIVAFLIGVVLLLPGACALGFLVVGVSALPSLGSAEWRGGEIWSLIGVAALGWGLCFLISYGGILMIRNAVKSNPPPAANPPPTGPGAPPPESR